MCNGLTVCINKQGKVLCDGSQHHDAVLWTSGIKNEQREKYLKYEILFPEWDNPIWDRGDDFCVNQIYIPQTLVDVKTKEPVKKIQNALAKWVKNNENFIKAQFFNNKRLLSNYDVELDLSNINLRSVDFSYNNLKSLNLNEANCNLDNMGIKGLYALNNNNNNEVNLILKTYQKTTETPTMGGLLQWLNNRAGLFKKIRR